MRRALHVLASVATLAMATIACSTDPTPYVMTDGGADVPAPKGQAKKLDFESASPGALPFELAHVLGDWRIETGTNGKLLKQAGEFETPDFPRVILRDAAFTNVHVKVRCSMEEGDTDRACGIMFRVRDSDNYYVARANTLEDNVRLYRVVAGDRQQFAGKEMPVQAYDWHTLEAFAEGTRIRILFDGAEVISADDTTFQSGKVGLWTKADSITSFDDFEATEL